MVLKGKAHKFKDNVNTDEIIAAKYLNTIDPLELGQHCMETIVPGFSDKISKGDIIVAGKNFGCGSSREHAPVAIKGAGISCVIAKSFAWIFYRNSINIGLPILECKEAGEIDEGDQLQVDLAKGEIRDLTKGNTYYTQKFPTFIQDIINTGGLMNWVKTRKKNA